MTRYFVELAYHGGGYVGWQNQPGQVSVQSAIEGSLATLLRREVSVVGCGRTDTGVHARQYFLHFDWEGDFPDYFLSRVNKVLGPNIVLYRLFPVAAKWHARYSATRRSYEYHLRLRKDPFSQQTAFLFPQSKQLHFDALQSAAALLMDYELFFPFCKSKSDVKTMRCQLFRSEWERRSADHWVFHISANRFLRGMVRLIVGMTLNVGTNKLALAQVKTALDQQERLMKSYSVPPQGLFLSEVHYPDLVASE
ncbi:MAG: tRNA pseudouridine synthase A [Bacteroidota bacterium]